MWGCLIANRTNANRYEYQGDDKITYHSLNHNIDVKTRWSETYYYFVSAVACKTCDLPYFPYRLSKYDKRRLLLNKNFDVETTFPLTPEQLRFINKTRIGKKISEVGKNEK